LVAKGDIISLTVKQLDDFESNYFRLLNKVLRVIRKPTLSIRKKFKSKYGRELNQQDLREILYNTLVVFQMMTNTYIWKSIFEWPQKISDREYMLSLDGMVLQRISDAYIKIYDTMKSEKLGISKT
jgi:hypothetical protein